MLVESLWEALIFCRYYHHLSVCVCVYACMRVYVCVYVCMCVCHWCSLQELKESGELQELVPKVQSLDDR